MNAHEAIPTPDASESAQGAGQLPQEAPEQQRLRESAELYAELYEDDAELRSLTEAAIAGWPD
ncbi:MAG: hypothetical protein NZ528_01130 [Caldilineales bacterium]|nr:hypothetical protein [Caldilineales bacterium]MCX7852542.1 hypothetical protein [Caldilineales bacterium]MDW8316558.1 hypothetical protein [Anaerolineae bacterium]